MEEDSSARNIQLITQSIDRETEEEDNELIKEAEFELSLPQHHLDTVQSLRNSAAKEGESSDQDQQMVHSSVKKK